MVAKGPVEEGVNGAGTMQLAMIYETGGIYTYDRAGGHPMEFPLDRHLFEFVWSFVPPDMEGREPCVAGEHLPLERSILRGKDNLHGITFYNFLSFSTDF